jgi:3-carboxy-cis,cis-muconate cycloisomerase
VTELSDTLFSAPEMTAVFSGSVFVQRMLDFEAALARAQAVAGVVPQRAADDIAAQCRVEQFDVHALFQEAAQAGTPAIPLVRRLSDLVGADARGLVHWGATSQDVIDTATVLQMREGLGVLIAGLTGLASACAVLAERHRQTPMPGRTLLQHAVPITFGLKAARWLAMTVRLIRRLGDLREGLAVQLGGAAGTLAAMGDHGVQVMELVARALDLRVPELPWHAERDRIADVAGALGTVAGAMGKIATDVVLLAQTEVGEASPAAPGTSSTMPQKRNPVEATHALACSRLAIGLVSALLAAMVQEHERGTGGWQAEWEAVPELFRFTSGAVRWTERAISGLDVDAVRMRANVDSADGLIMAEALTMMLASKIGRDEAYRVVQRISDQVAHTHIPLREAALADPQLRDSLSAWEVDRTLEVEAYRGSTDAFIDRALNAFRALQGSTREPR